MDKWKADARRYKRQANHLWESRVAVCSSAQEDTKNIYWRPAKNRMRDPQYCLSQQGCKYTASNKYIPRFNSLIKSRLICHSRCLTARKHASFRWRWPGGLTSQLKRSHCTALQCQDPMQVLLKLIKVLIDWFWHLQQANKLPSSREESPPKF